MKHILRLLVVAALFALTISVAAFRTDPDVSPELYAERTDTAPAFSEIANALDLFTRSESTPDSSLAESVLSSVVETEITGKYTADGQAILDVELPAAAVPVIREAVSAQLGDAATTEELLDKLNSTENIIAVQNEDGSVSIELPEQVYEQYADQLAGLLP